MKLILSIFSVGYIALTIHQPGKKMEKIIKQPELIKMLGISRGTLFNMRNNGEIPQPRKISTRCIGWLQSDINEWLQSRPFINQLSGLQN